MTEGKTVQIIEITKVASQGRSEPYLCVGDDKLNYYVKGRQSGSTTPIYEWICGHLAKALDLPVPTFKLVEVSKELLDVTSAELRSIGACVAFASQEVPLVCWFEEANIAKVEDELQRRILIFDWWIRNEDRTRQNPNLLWDSANQRVAVIDHNLAFDTEFNPDDFKEYHLFGHHWNNISSDMVSRLAIQKQLEAAIPAFDAALKSMPRDWLWIDAEETLPTTLDIDRLRNQLLRCQTDDFWRA